MSNVCCALCNVVVKTPDDPLTRRPHPWCGTIWSSGHFVSGSFYNFIEHRTTDIRHLTSLGLTAFFHTFYDRPLFSRFDIAGGHRPPLQNHSMFDYSWQSA